MGILRSWLVLIAVISAIGAHAAGVYDEPNTPPEEANLEELPANRDRETDISLLCHSTQEYIKTLKFFRETKELILPETSARKISERVSRGCDGSSERFQRVLVLLKRVGLSDPKALEISLDFAGRSPDVQKNFTEIFTRTFLTEFFDYDYKLAAQLAFELSRDYAGDPRLVREDFIDLVRFCKSDKNLDLPARLCAEFTLKLVRLSQYFPRGIRDSFYSLFNDLRTKPGYGLDVKSALDVTYGVLKSGPLAPENFFSAFEYATQKDGLDLSQHQALEFALEMSKRSFVGSAPPLVPAAKDPPKVHHVVGQK